MERPQSKPKTDQAAIRQTIQQVIEHGWEMTTTLRPAGYGRPARVSVRCTCGARFTGIGEGGIPMGVHVGSLAWSNAAGRSWDSANRSARADLDTHIAEVARAAAQMELF